MGSSVKYEMWRLHGPNGKDSYHIFPAGRISPEILKLGEKVPMTPEMEEVLAQAVAQAATGR